MGIVFSTMAGKERRLCLMSGMLERLGVDVVSLSLEARGNQLQRAAATCLSCDNTEICAAWQGAGESPSPHDPLAFCPNARLFERHTF